MTGAAASLLPASLIMTVLNEMESLPEFLSRLDEQTALPAELVIVDGGSTDGTWRYLSGASVPAGMTLRCVQMVGANISSGRNLAIQEASFETVLVSDGGVTLDPHWCEQLWKGLDEDARVDVAAGFFEPAGSTRFQRALARIITPLLDEIDGEKFLPSSRSVAFRRSAWLAAGGYPEWLDYCEDLVFDIAMKQSGAVFVFVPGAVARWNARSSWRGYARQYYRYARGDGKAGLWRRRHAARYIAYGGAAAIAARSVPVAALVVGIGGVAYARRYFRRVVLSPEIRGAERAYAAALVPAVMFVGDVAKMVGYPVGLAWRLRERSRRRTHGGSRT